MGEAGNALSRASSAYLRSAMHQPVRWREWGEEAFAVAERENKPVLLDIGAVWCHWCHVMDRESYESDETAEIINRDFIATNWRSLRFPAPGAGPSPSFSPPRGSRSTAVHTFRPTTAGVDPALRRSCWRLRRPTASVARKYWIRPARSCTRWPMPKVLPAGTLISRRASWV